MIRDSRFRWAAAIVFILLLASIIMGGKHYRDVKKQHELARAETREESTAPCASLRRTSLVAMANLLAATVTVYAPGARSSRA
jgi:hypothetical protein